ncbi:hypothetical protein [Chryseobacterium gallinarum]|nr:hypothetical protein [Chryseobacterium gallinarum]
MNIRIKTDRTERNKMVKEVRMRPIFAFFLRKIRMLKQQVWVSKQ